MRLFIALLAAACVVAGAPFVGQVRGALQSALPGQYRAIVSGLVLAAIAAALVTAVVRIREQRWRRYGWLATALALGVAFARLTRTGNLDVDAVERFHFVEYGVVTLLFYRVWRDRADLTALALPCLAALLTGIADEWLQWFVPARVGEMRDVLLNGIAIVCGLLFGLGVNPPPSLAWWRHASSRVMLAAWTAAALVALAVLLHAAHLGYDVHVDDRSQFRSQYTRTELREAARERSVRWRTRPPTALRRLSREDHYLGEGLWHVQRRNVAWAANDNWSAWHENVILETFFAPVLEFPSFAGPARWSPGQRAAAAAQAGDTRPFVSQAHPLPLFTWDRRWFWAGVGATVAAAVAACMVAGRAS